MSIGKFIMTVSAAALCLSAQAVVTEFSYNCSGAAPEGFGTGKAETCDVAVWLGNPDMEGLRVTGFSVPVMGETDGLSGFKGFLTTALKTRNAGGERVNDPDICECDASVADGILSVVFDSPYEIGAGGVYVGYSLTVDEGHAGAAPVAVTSGSIEGAFWFHSTSTQLKWNDYSKRRNLMSGMTVCLDGDIAGDAVALSIAGGQYAAVGEAFSLKVSGMNDGLSPVASVGYRVKAGDSETSGTVEMDSPVPAVFGCPFGFEIPVPAFARTGETEVEVELTEVNGRGNGSRRPMAASKVDILPFLPVKRPLVEEYTGLNCVWCPQGYVMLEEMGEEHGDMFVGLSYHSSSYEDGCMVFLDHSEFPYSPSGYPQATVDRRSAYSIFDVSADWEEARDILPVGEVSVDLRWADDGHTRLEAVARSRFVKDFDGGRYKIAFALVADGLSGPTWKQANAYAMDGTDTTGLEGKYWDLFIGTEERVGGLVFNDVVVYYPDVNGVANSLPDEIVAGETYESVFTVDTGNVRNVDGEDVVRDFGMTRVVAVITDAATGKPENCVSSGYPSGSGSVEESGLDRVAEPVEYYDMTGRRVVGPVQGLVIIRYGDGTCRKAIVR